MIDETVEEIEDMHTHSSSEVALKATRALRSVTDGEYATVEEYLRSLQRNSRALRHANLSHASLYNSTHAIESAVIEADPADVAAAKEVTDRAIDDELDRINTAKDAAAHRAASLIEPGGTYLTLDFSTTLLAAFEEAGADAAEPITVITMEARPRYLGRKMARRLASFDGINPTLMVDSAALSQVPACDRILVGMTCVVDETLYNRVGTHPLAIVADHHDVPMHAVGSERKIVEDTFQFENEYRSPSEVSLEPIDDIDIENPAYDATHVGLLESVVTDAGTRFESLRAQ